MAEATISGKGRKMMAFPGAAFLVTEAGLYILNSQELALSDFWFVSGMREGGTVKHY